MLRGDSKGLLSDPLEGVVVDVDITTCFFLLGEPQTVNPVVLHLESPGYIGSGPLAMIQLCMVFIRMIDGFPLWQGSPFRNQSQVSNSFRYESGVRKVLDARLKFVVNTFRSSSRFRRR